MISDKNKHFEKCEAPICFCAKEPNNDVVWLPGEKVCKYPSTNIIQKRQTNINNLLAIGKLRRPDAEYTSLYLLKHAV